MYQKAVPVAHATYDAAPVDHATYAAALVAHATYAPASVAHATYTAAPVAHATDVTAPVAHATDVTAPVAHATIAAAPVAHATFAAAPVAHATWAAPSYAAQSCNFFVYMHYKYNKFNSSATKLKKRCFILFSNVQYHVLNKEFIRSFSKFVLRGESAALGHFSVTIFFGQADNEKSKNKYSSIAV